MERDRPAVAGLAAAASCIEPHMGLPACLALFVWAPRTRVSLAASAFVLGALAIAAGGVAGVARYFTQVLPVHQLSEIGDPIQYSLTWLLHAVDYGLTVVASVLLARRVCRQFDSHVPLVLFPPAVAMLGGPFVHVFEIVGALPFALFVAGRTATHRSRR